ncbi:hypothetical protein GCM10022248_30150 [Nonomuraea soli]
MGDAYVPLKDDNKVAFSFTLKDPYGPPTDKGYPVVTTGAAGSESYHVAPTITSVQVQVLMTGDAAGPAVTLDTAVPPPNHVVKPPLIPNPGETPAPFTHTPSAPTTAEVKGSFLIKESNKDKVGNWKLKVTVARASGSTESCKEFAVAGQSAVASGTVSPTTVQLKKGVDVPLKVVAEVKNAKNVSMELRSHDGTMWVNVPLYQDGDGLYRNTAHLADDTTPGSWYFVVKATRNNEQIEATGHNFTVVAPVDGIATKTKSRITIKAPAKAKLSKAFKLSGKAYRGTKGYSGKILELYFKKKGKKSFTFMGFVKTTSTGIWQKNVKQKYDGYWRVIVPGTSKTKKSYATSKLVDIR